MEIVQVQVEPHPIYETRGYGGRKDFNAILAWLYRDDLPENLSFALEGALFRFTSTRERLSFALGFDKAFDLYDSEVTRDR